MHSTLVSVKMFNKRLKIKKKTKDWSCIWLTYSVWFALFFFFISLTIYMYLINKSYRNVSYHHHNILFLVISYIYIQYLEISSFLLTLRIWRKRSRDGKLKNNFGNKWNDVESKMLIWNLNSLDPKKGESDIKNI